MKNDNFKKVVDAVRDDKKLRFPILSLVRNDPGLAAVLSKLTSSTNPIQYDNAGMRDSQMPNSHMFRNTSDLIAQNVNDARTVLQVLPDMELAAQILVSSIIAPKDMVTTELTYSVIEGLIAPDVGAALITRTKKYFEHDYKIKPLLAKMLRDILFETGSYAIAVLPENTIDDVINGKHNITLENLSEHIDSNGMVKPLGLLGPAISERPTVERAGGGLSLESLKNHSNNKLIDGRVTLESAFQKTVDTFLTVTDNHNLLKIPQINQRVREERIASIVGIKALESFSSKINDRQMTGMVYGERNTNYMPITKLKTQEQLNRKTVGNPLILHLPSESVIPVYVPGCVEEQIGFFVLIDENGNPVTKADNVDQYQQLSTRLSSNGSFPSAMLSRVRAQMQGFVPDNKEHMDFATRAYGDIIEQDLLARLRNGVYGNGVALAKNEEIYRIMFSRTLAKQHTQLLFIPVELMTYIAFSFTPDGIGKSLLDNMKILNSLRSMVLFANVMASLKNSIGRTEVKLKLDETDPNPQKTIEVAMHEIIRSRQQYFPLGMNSPADLTDWLQKSGFEFTFEGHPGLPDVSVDFGEKATNYVKPDVELETNLRKQAIMACGLSPETVDNTFNAEFAVSVVTNNILLSKRVTQTQEQFTPQLSSHLRKCMMNSEELINDLRKILEDNFDKLKVEAEKDGELEDTVVEKKATTADEKKQLVNNYLRTYIMNFEVKLPEPNNVTLENQMSSLDTYSKALDVSLDAWISEKFFTTDTGGDVAAQVATVKEVVKAYYLRKWMAENGVMGELAEISLKTYDGSPMVDIFKLQEEHLANLTSSLTKFMVGLNKVKEASNKIMSGIDTTAESGEAGGETGDETGGEEAGGETDDELPDEVPEETDDEVKVKEEDKTNLNDELPEEEEKKE